jgi:hypothetical protein
MDVAARHEAIQAGERSRGQNPSMRVDQALQPQTVQLR